jgi:hypothetical protein
MKRENCESRRENVREYIDARHKEISQEEPEFENGPQVRSVATTVPLSAPLMQAHERN